MKVLRPFRAGLLGWAVACVLLAPVPVFPAQAAPADIVLADAVTGVDPSWKSVGPAFVRAPGGSPDRKSENGKSAEGALYSPAFTVDRDYLNLWIVGGDHPFRAAASLWIDIFLFFWGMMVLHLVWVSRMVPETKGASLEEIQQRQVSK